MNSTLPILYSFRRCPYAIRARIALYYSQIDCELREVNLKNKPSDMLLISPKGTVPVMQFPGGKIIDESLDIMLFAISQNDPKKINYVPDDLRAKISKLINENDNKFASLLHKYKYHEKYPDNNQLYYRLQIEELFLKKYESMLSENKYLFKNESLADFAILPFIRQMAFVDEEWFFNSSYPNIIRWLKSYIEAEYFEEKILAKHPPWKKGDLPIYFL